MNADFMEIDTKPPPNPTLVSIDVGIINLGCVTCEIIDEDTAPETRPITIQKITKCRLMNIKELTLKCQKPNCRLKHEPGSAIDWVNHFIQLFREDLEKAKYILIEKQPPGGLQHIEVLLTQEFREKVTLIYPRTLHKWLNISSLTYDQRKIETEKRASKYLENYKDWVKFPERRHDMADSLCFILYFLAEKDKLRRQTIEIQKFNILSQELIGRHIEKYAYTPISDDGYETDTSSNSGKSSPLPPIQLTSTRPDICPYCFNVDENNIVDDVHNGTLLCMSCGMEICFMDKIETFQQNNNPPPIESFKYQRSLK